MTIPCRTARLRAPHRMARLLSVAAVLLAFTFLNSHVVHAMRIQEVKSRSGITAWLVEERSVPLLALRFAFQGGSAHDPAGKEGLANFLTTMLDEGAGTLDARAFQERAEALALRMGFEDSRDAFYGSFETLSGNRAAAVEMLRLALNEPRFDADAADRMRAQILSALAYAEKNPDQVVAREWFALAYAGHPYGRPAKGTKASVGAITRDDLAAFRKRLFARSNLTIVAVGDIDAKGLAELIDNVFGALPEKADLAPLPAYNIARAAKRRVIELDVPQSAVQIGFAGIARNDPDFIPAFVMNEILGGGGLSSRLMVEVREKRGLAYGTYSYLMPLKAGSAYLASVKTKNEAVAQSIDIIRAEIRRMAEVGPTEKELADIKSYLTGSFPLRLDTNAKIAAALLGFQMDGLGLDYVERRNRLVDAVTLDDVRRVARRVLNADALIVVIAGKPVGLANDG